MTSSLAKTLLYEALKLDNSQQHLPAVTKYLEALVYLNKSLLDLCSQRDVKLGKKDFGNQVLLASDCLKRVCEIHELFKESLLTRESANGHSLENAVPPAGTSANNGAPHHEHTLYATVGPNDPVTRAIDYNRRLLCQFDQTIRKRTSTYQTNAANSDQKLLLEKKRFENLSLAQESRKSNGEESPSQHTGTWNPRSKTELASRIRDRSQSEHRISSNSSTSVNGNSGIRLSKYMEMLAKEDNVDLRIVQHGRLPKLEEHFGTQIVAGLASEERKRQAAILEFLYTEQTHLRNLKIVQILFKLPLVDNQLLPANFVFPYLRMTLVELLFGNLEEVIDVHSTISHTLSSVMKERRPVVKFGEIMLQFFDDPFAERFMSAVSKFCRHQQYAFDQLEIRRRQDERFANFLQEVESLPICRGLKLGAMLPMEIQRITKYHLMFERVLEYEPRDTEHSEKLQRCYTKAKEIAEYVNAEKRAFESVHKLAELQYRLENPNPTTSGDSEVGQQNFNLQGRVYIYDGPLCLHLGPMNIDIHGVLLQGYFLILTKSSADGYRLRLCSMHLGRNSSGQRFIERDRLNPVIPLSAAALRDDKDKSFYIISGLDDEVQVYHLEASTDMEKSRWCALISEEIAKAAGLLKRQPSQTSSVDNIRSSLGVIEYTSDADFDDFSDDDN